MFFSYSVNNSDILHEFPTAVDTDFEFLSKQERETFTIYNTSAQIQSCTIYKEIHFGCSVLPNCCFTVSKKKFQEAFNKNCKGNKSIFITSDKKCKKWNKNLEISEFVDDFAIMAKMKYVNQHLKLYKIKIILRNALIYEQEILKKFGQKYHDMFKVFQQL